MAGRELRSLRCRTGATFGAIIEIPSSPSEPPIKRQRTSSSPVFIPDISPRPQRHASILESPSTSIKSTKSERSRLFDALASEAAYPLAGTATAICSEDDLSEAQLKKCFEILHACGGATDPSESLARTRDNIEGFLDAIFYGWSSRRPGNLIRPELEFRVDAHVVAGRICCISSHKTIHDCDSSESCTADVTAVAKYSNNPPMFMLEYTTIDPFNNQPEPFCPIARSDICWVTTGWIQDLRAALHAKVVSKIHNFNKRLAVWQARGLIVEWSKGSLGMGDDVSELGFLGRGPANIAVIGLGKDG